MKLISLNTWCGRAGKDGLLDFFRRHEDVDVFCFQEIWEGGHDHAPRYGGDIDTTLLSDIGIVLKDYSVFFRPHYMDWYGLAIFAKKHLKVQEEGDIFVFKERKDAFNKEDASHARNLQYITFETPHGLRTITNFHGLWTGIDKDDTDERLMQSDNIGRFLQNIPNPYLLCGDFNLLPETKSLKKLEDLGMRNLIKEFGITSTRSSHYKKPVRFADYALVSSGITVKEFKVLSDEVSDHLAMYLDFK